MIPNTFELAIKDKCGVDLRRVTELDEEFLLGLYSSVREAELSLVPWNAEQKSAFLGQQFKAQKDHYRHEYPKAEHCVILRDESNAGMMYIDFTDDEIKILDLIILPAMRSVGIGKCILEALQIEAAGLRMPITVFVDQEDRSRSFFDRLGFKPVEEQGMHVLLRWDPM